jgi:hypothetical protein
MRFYQNIVRTVHRQPVEMIPDPPPAKAKEIPAKEVHLPRRRALS